MAGIAVRARHWQLPSGYPPLPQFIAYLLMALGMFMAILDIQIVSASLREIQAGLSASSDEIVWVQSSYLIAEVVMIPLSGFLGRALSTRWLFVLSSGGFTIASALCATATSIEEMIVYRALQGFLGGAMIPTTYAMSYSLFGNQRQVGVTVAVSMIVTLAPTIGPVLGGWITDYFSWKMLFLINLVPGIVITAAVASLMDVDEPDFALLKRIDVPGLLLMFLFLGAFEYVLEEGARKQWLEDSTIRWLSFITLISGIAFFIRLATAREPIVRMESYRNYNFAAGTSVGAILGVGLYGLTYIYPLFLAQVVQLSSGQIGSIMSISGLSMVLSAPISGVLTRHFDARFVSSGGFLMLALSCWMSRHMTADWRFDELLVPQILRGSGLMIAVVPLNAVAFATLPPRLMKDGAGLFTLLRNFGGAVGLAMINTVLLWRTNFHWSRLSEHVSTFRPEVQQRLDDLAATLDGAGDGATLALKQVSLYFLREVTVMAFEDCFFLLSIAFCLVAVVPLLMRRPAAVAAPGEVH